MKDMMAYKGYYGSVHYNDEDQVFHGKIEFIRSLISYEGTDVESLRRAFEEAVLDYLELCKEEGKEPEIPFKGSFNVRIPAKLHKRAIQHSSMLGMSLNQFVKKSIEDEIKSLD